MKAIFSFLGGLFKPAGDAYKAYKDAKVKLKLAKIGAKTARYMAEEQRWHKAKDIEADWDLRAQEQAKFSWKDEFLLVVVMLPFIGSFIPVVQDYVAKGWTEIAKAPHWYYVLLFGVFAAVFGLRWWFQQQRSVLNKFTGQKEKSDAKTI